ncbi:MAG TPA: hypothetical protein VN922_09140 [Bacteroidia bacterium]|nr:hypothetical protein [Bacteroidia bacterium]
MAGIVKVAAIKPISVSPVKGGKVSTSKVGVGSVPKISMPSAGKSQSMGHFTVRIGNEKTPSMPKIATPKLASAGTPQRIKPPR